MRISLRFFSVFLAVLLPAILLLASPYTVLADEILPEFAAGEAVAVEQINEDTDEISEDTNPLETGSGDILGDEGAPEIGNSDVLGNEYAPETGGIVLEDENLPKTGDEGETTEQGNEGLESPVITLYDEASPDFIGSQNAFQEWISNHTKNGNVTGGSIELGSDITVKKHILLSGSLSIETGAYGLTMNGGSIGGAPFSITGDGISADGIPTPVLTVVNMNYNPWDALASCYSVTARGRDDGKGGVAVRVSTRKSGSPDFIEDQGLIRSEGEGAVGVLFDYPVEAHYLSVSVEGKNSVAVSAPDGASLYYGRLEASGDGSKIVSGGNILLDTCKISGDADRADVVNRKIVSLAGSCLYWPLAQGQTMANSGLFRTFYAPFMPPSFLLSGNEAHPAEERMIPARWNQDELDLVDTSVPGKTIISGELDVLYQGLGLEDDFSLDLTVDVQEGGKPCIVSLKFGNDIGTGRRYVNFATNDLDDDWFKLEAGNFILWRSDNEGQKWYKFTDSNDVSFTNDSITYKYDEIKKPVWFCIQEIDGEYSNIAVVYGYEGNSCGALSGDRTGVDRGEEDSETSHVPKPTPPPEPESTPESEPTPEPESTMKSASPSRSTSQSKLSWSSSPDKPSDTAVQTSEELISPLPADAPSATNEIQISSETHNNITLPYEWENKTTTAVSGKRLRVMMDAGDRVTFIKNEVRLSFDTPALEELDIGDGQLFTVSVARLEQFKYTVSATLDGSELYGLPCVATLDGNKHDILVAGVYDFTPLTDEPDVIPVQTHSPDLAVTQPSKQIAVEEKANNPADMEENPVVSPPAIFAMLGVGCVIAAAVFVRFRVKKYGR